MGTPERTVPIRLEHFGRDLGGGEFRAEQSLAARFANFDNCAGTLA